MLKNKAAYVSIFLLFIFTLFAVAQNRKQLEQQKQKQLNEIATLRKIIEQTQTDQQESLALYEAMGLQIAARQKLLHTIERGVHLKQRAIDSINNQILLTQKQQAHQKERYANLIVQAYKTQSGTTVMSLLFNANSFRQALRRSAYLRSIARWRANQLSLLNKTEEKLNNLKEKAIAEKNEQRILLLEQKNETQKLAREKDQQKQVLNKLKDREKELKKKLKAEQKTLKKLEKAIEKAIAEELRKAREAERRRKEAEKKEGMYKTLPADAISGEFVAGKQKLPWPVNSGFVSRKFGKQPHPTLSNITIENNGINLRTVKGGQARAVFDGEVTAVLDIPGMNKVVMIKHGTYFTVYANLEDVHTEKGQNISAGDVLGTIFTDETGQTELHFELWEGSAKKDPLLWLSPALQ